MQNILASNYQALIISRAQYISGNADRGVRISFSWGVVVSKLDRLIDQ